MSNPAFVADHAVTIDATPDEVWPWLAQVGWHRGGWYTARWVDQLLFPANEPSLYDVIPELQGLKVGDFVPDGPPETQCGFTVERLERNHCLLLHSDTHLPLSWRAQGRASIDWTWCFVLQPLDSGRRTRFIFRWRATVAPWWLRTGFWFTIYPADLVMSRDMLHGLRRRVEALAAGGPGAPSPPSALHRT